MTDIKHLTNNQLIAYSDGKLEKHESHVVGRHLLMCDECLKRLPVPSVEMFWAALLKDDDAEDDPATEKSNILTSFSTVFSPLLNINSGLVLGGAALVLILSFSFVIWLSKGNQSNDVVQNFEIGNDLGFEINNPVPIQSPSMNAETSSSNSNRIAVSSTPKQPKIESPKPKSLQESKVKLSSNGQNPKEKQDVISSTRGVSAKCTENADLDYELSGDKENFVFKWKKVPNAVKYHLYISDDDEILIDEYESETETSFVLRKPLDPLKTYKWKIIVTLENGQQVVGNWQKFTTKDFQTNQKKVEKKKATETRCSANG